MKPSPRHVDKTSMPDSKNKFERGRRRAARTTTTTTTHQNCNYLFMLLPFTGGCGETSSTSSRSAFPYACHLRQQPGGCRHQKSGAHGETSSTSSSAFPYACQQRWLHRRKGGASPGETSSTSSSVFPYACHRSWPTARQTNRIHLVRVSGDPF